MRFKRSFPLKSKQADAKIQLCENRCSQCIRDARFRNVPPEINLAQSGRRIHSTGVDEIVTG